MEEKSGSKCMRMDMKICCNLSLVHEIFQTIFAKYAWVRCPRFSQRIHPASNHPYKSREGGKGTHVEPHVSPVPSVLAYACSEKPARTISMLAKERAQGRGGSSLCEL
jgi:hypothetical protein